MVELFGLIDIQIISMASAAIGVLAGVVNWIVRLRARIIKKYGFILLKHLVTLKNILMRNQPVLNPELEIIEIEWFDERIDTFWSEIKDCYDFIIVRTKDYLNWRYCDPRGGSYKIFLAEKNDRVLGFSVLRVNKFEYRCPTGYIVDLIALPNRLDVVSSLIDRMLSYFDSQKINNIRYLSTVNHPYGKIFEQFGFIDTGTSSIASYEPSLGLEDELSIFSESPANRIHFTYGDVDHI